MNLKRIFENTDFVHASGTKEELQVAEYLKGQCEQLGVKAWRHTSMLTVRRLSVRHLPAAEAVRLRVSCIICRVWTRYQ